MNNAHAHMSETDMLFGPATTVPTPQPGLDTSRFDRLQARVIPLKDRLRDQLATLPDDLKLNGLHMTVIWPLCVGRQRLKPPAHEVGAALRALGWQRMRLYSDANAPSGTYWFPPGVNVASAKAAMRDRIGGAA